MKPSYFGSFSFASSAATDERPHIIVDEEVAAAMSLKFLNLKGWHPSNKTNQKRIWIAEQKARDQEQKEKEAADEVRKSADLQRFQQLAAAKGDPEAARRMEVQQVGFMYAPPPGLQKVDEAAGGDVTEGALMVHSSNSTVWLDRSVANHDVWCYSIMCY